MSRGVYRGIYSALPDDPDFQRLSPSARLTLYTCRLCAQAGPAAIFRSYPELLCKQTGLSARRLDAALAELEREHWIVREGVVLWVRNGLRHDPSLRLTNLKHRVAVLRAIAALPHLTIVLSFCDYYQLPRPFDTPSDTYPELALRVRDRDRDSVSTREVVHTPAAPASRPPRRSAHAPDPTRSAPDPRPLAELIDGAVQKHTTRAADRVTTLKRAQGKVPPAPF